MCNETGTTELMNCLTLKGCNSINIAGQQKKVQINAVPGDYVHIRCRQDFISPESIAAIHKRSQDDELQPTESYDTWSQQYFNFHEHCMFCGTKSKFDKKKSPAMYFQLERKISKPVLKQYV